MYNMQSQLYIHTTIWKKHREIWKKATKMKILVCIYEYYIGLIQVLQICQRNIYA